MKSNITPVSVVNQTRDAEFFDSAIRFRTLQEEVNELELELDHLIKRRNKLEFGELMKLEQMEEITRLSEEIDKRQGEMDKIVEGLISKFYPSNPTVRKSLNGVWIGVKPMTAIRFSEDLKSIELLELQ